MSKWETKNKMNPWKQKFPYSECIRRIQLAEKNKNMKILYRVGVLLVLKVEVLLDNIELTCWKKKERERKPPTVAFDYGFLTQENADTLPILICRDSTYGYSGATCCERKGPTAYSISFLVGFIKDMGFHRIIVKCDNEPSTKALQDAVIHACLEVEVIPEGPPQGDHMVNGRVEMTVREVKRQCRTLRISAEQNTSVHIADDSPLLSWVPRFAAQVC